MYMLAPLGIRYERGDSFRSQNGLLKKLLLSLDIQAFKFPHLLPESGKEKRQDDR